MSLEVRPDILAFLITLMYEQRHKFNIELNGLGGTH